MSIGFKGGVMTEPIIFLSSLTGLYFTIKAVSQIASAYYNKETTNTTFSVFIACCGWASLITVLSTLK